MKGISYDIIFLEHFDTRKKKKNISTSVRGVDIACFLWSRLQIILNLRCAFCDIPAIAFTSRVVRIFRDESRSTSGWPCVQDRNWITSVASQHGSRVAECFGIKGNSSATMLAIRVNLTVLCLEHIKSVNIYVITPFAFDSCKSSSYIHASVCWNILPQKCKTKFSLQPIWLQSRVSRLWVMFQVQNKFSKNCYIGDITR